MLFSNPVHKNNAKEEESNNNLEELLAKVLYIYIYIFMNSPLEQRGTDIQKIKQLIIIQS